MTTTPFFVSPVLATARLTLRLPGPEDAPALLDFYTRNASYLRPYSPAFPDTFFTLEHWRRHAERCEVEYRHDMGARLILCAQQRPDTVVGVANLSAIQRGPAQYANLGYSLDHDRQGLGFMNEALRDGVIPFAFHTLNLHRIQANYMPTNARSGALLRRLGFVVDGYARDYLLINGRWEDHILTSLVNSRWAPPSP